MLQRGTVYSNHFSVRMPLALFSQAAQSSACIAEASRPSLLLLLLLLSPPLPWPQLQPSSVHAS